MNKWIPITERLPEMSDDLSGVYKSKVLCLVTTEKGNVQKSSFSIKHQAFMPFTDMVVAWQPLPAAYKERKKKSFTIVECVTPGKGYEEGKLYPMGGWNNGVHIMRITEEGDPITECFMCGGIGKGIINSWDEDGVPSFNPVSDF